MEAELLTTTNSRHWKTQITATSQLLMMSAEPIILRYYLVIRCLDRYQQLSEADLEEICCKIAYQIHEEYGFHSPEYADPHVLQVFFKQLIKMRLIKREGGRIRLNFCTEQLFRESHQVLRPQLITLVDRCLKQPLAHQQSA